MGETYNGRNFTFYVMIFEIISPSRLWLLFFSLKKCGPFLQGLTGLFITFCKVCFEGFPFTLLTPFALVMVEKQSIHEPEPVGNREGNYRW